MTQQNAYAFGRESTTSQFARRRAERLLFQVPVCLSIALGAGLMLTRFILALKDELQSQPDSWQSVLLLAVIVASAGFLMVLSCAAVGLCAGYALRRLLAGRLARALEPGSPDPDGLGKW